EYAVLIGVDHDTLKPLVAQVVDIDVIASEQDQRPENVRVLLNLGAVLQAHLRHQLFDSVDQSGRPLLRNISDLFHFLAEASDHSLQPMIYLPAAVRQLLLKRTQEPERDGFPKISDVRHVGEDEVRATRNRLAPHDPQEVSLA